MATLIESSNITNALSTWERFGSWSIDGNLDHGTAPTGACTVVIGDLSFTGDIKRSGEDAPDKPHFVLVGGLRWHSPIAKPLSFQNDSGVKLRTVLKSLASAAGITAIEYPSDVTIGRYYECIASRPGHEQTYADALNELYFAGYCPRWRVDADGVTRFGDRAATKVTARQTVLSPNKGVGVTTYGIDSPMAFWPGATLEDGTVIQKLQFKQSRAGKLEMDSWAAESVPSIRDLIRAMVADLDDPVRSYVVKTCHADGRLDLAPPSDSPHLPEMQKVEQWVLGGSKYKATIGDEVAVMFRDRRKTRPMVIGFKLDSGTFTDAALKGDDVKVLMPPATFTGTIGGSPASGVILWSVPYTMGNIQGPCSQKISHKP